MHEGTSWSPDDAVGDDPLGIGEDLQAYSARHTQALQAQAVAEPPADVASELPPVPAQTQGEAAVAPSDQARPAAGGVRAADFLDRRVGEHEDGPATWGWRGRVRRWSGGAVQPRMGPDERRHLDLRRRIQREFDGPRTVVFVNPKGGAAKTTGVLAAGYTFGTVRGGGVIAWDNNETRGTLGIRGLRGTHRATTRELLEDLGRFNDVQQARIGELGAFVRSQGDAQTSTCSRPMSAPT